MSNVTDTDKLVSKQDGERSFRSVSLNGWVNRAELTKCPRPRARSVQVVKSIPQDRSSERRCEQSDVIKVTSSQNQIWQRTVEQNLDDTWHELASRSLKRIREKTGIGKKEKNPQVFFHVLRNACFPDFSRHRRTSTGNALQLVRSHVACVSKHSKNKNVKEISFCGRCPRARGRKKKYGALW